MSIRLQLKLHHWTKESKGVENHPTIMRDIKSIYFDKSFSA